MREQMKEWTHAGKMEQVRRLTQNGITQKDLDECFDKGYTEGFKNGTDKTLKTVYAGIILQLLEDGNDDATAIGFLRDLDNRLITSISEEEDIESVFDKTGVRLMLKEDFDRVKEVAEVV